jgi:hypothetical protein
LEPRYCQDIIKRAGRAASGCESDEAGNPLGRGSEGRDLFSPRGAPSSPAFVAIDNPATHQKSLVGLFSTFSSHLVDLPLDGSSLVLHCCPQALTQNQPPHCRTIKHHPNCSDLPLHFFPFKSGVREISLVTPLNLALYPVPPFPYFPISLSIISPHATRTQSSCQTSDLQYGFRPRCR